MDLETIAKIGGPVLVLSTIVIVFYHKTVGQLLKLLGNHLSHVEASNEKLVEGQAKTNTLLHTLVDRIDRPLDR
jgi:hypothetical protein